MKTFSFVEPGSPRDGNLWLETKDRRETETPFGMMYLYSFTMRLDGIDGRVGGITLRIGAGDALENYVGHLGYGVEPGHQGQRLAARSCRLALPLAAGHGIDPLWITCNPDNVASRRTCEIIGAEFVDTVTVPRDVMQAFNFQENDGVKCRYRLRSTE